MKVIKMRSGRVHLDLSISEFAALTAIVDTGFKEAQKMLGGRGFGAFKDGLSITRDKSDEPQKHVNNLPRWREASSKAVALAPTPDE